MSSVGSEGDRRTEPRDDRATTDRDAHDAAKGVGAARAFVVLEGGRFTLCSHGEVRELDVDDLLARAAERPVPEYASLLPAPWGKKALPPRIDLPPSRSPTFDRAIVEPGRGVVAELGGSAARIYLDLQQRWLVLGSDHLRLAAAIRAAVSVSTLRQQALVPADVFSEILRDLVAAGVLRVAESGSSSHPTTPQNETSERLGGQGNGQRWMRKHSDEVARKLAPIGPPRFGHTGRVPVFSFWATDEGPHHGVSAVVAYARVAFGGMLNEHFELVRNHPAERVLDDLRHTTGPAILLCSDYIWSLEANERVVAEALKINPDTLVIHGGPCVPKYEADCERFVRGLPPGSVAISNEGEITFAETLAALARHRDPASGRLDVRALADVLGVAYLDVDTGNVVRTPERPRHNNLEDFPSAMLTGEYDDVPEDIVVSAAVWPVESIRGCPFQCTFCDWGSATMTKIRKFPMERVVAELEWIAAKGCRVLYIADANFGMLPRDTEIAEHVVRIHKKRNSREAFFCFSPAKNVPKRLVAILDTLLDAGLMVRLPLALQSRDQPTLDAIQRTNIKTATYDELGQYMRRRGIPLIVELMVGLPGSTVASFKEDLQWALDQQVVVMRYSTFVLPNSPMNDPDYRRKWAIESENGVVVATSSYTREDRRELDRLSYAYQCLEALGILRHVLRYLQWDQGRRSIDVIHDLERIAHTRPDEAPLLHWLFNNADQFLTPPVGWAPLYAEIHHLLVTHLGVTDDAGLRTAFAVNQFLMPVRGRSFPDTLELEHDYVAYYRSALVGLYSLGGTFVPDQALVKYGAGRLTAEDLDDLPSSMLGRLSEDRLLIDDASTRRFAPFWMSAHLELWSPVIALPPLMSGELGPYVRELVAERHRLATGVEIAPSPAPSVATIPRRDSLSGPHRLRVLDGESGSGI